MTEKTKGNATLIFTFLLLIGMVSFAVFIVADIAMSYETRYILIDGDDIISYDVVDGDTVIIVTESETYEVELSEDVVDFTVSSDIHIKLAKGYSRTFFWDEFEPTDNDYWIDRIIKVPSGGEQ